MALAGVDADQRGRGRHRIGVHGGAGTSHHWPVEGAGGEGGIGSDNW